MEYTEIQVFAPARYTDLISLLLCECGSHGSVIHDTDETDSVCVTAYFPASATGAAAAVRRGLENLQFREPCLQPWRLEVHTSADTDWLYNWQKYFHATKVTERIWVEPAWETDSPAGADIVIRLDPGQAFGSGLHATTAMCLTYLEEVVRPGQRVYDVGTGTGVLAIAAAKLGAAQVLAVDQDEQAVAQAAVNAGLNQTEDCVIIRRSDLLTAVPADGRKADVVAANLVTDAVKALLPSLPPYLAAGAWVIVSGVIDERLEEVRRLAAETGYAWVSEQLREGWYAVLLRRR